MRLRSVAVAVLGVGTSVALAEVPVKMALVPIEQIPVPAARPVPPGQSLADQSPSTRPSEPQAQGNVIILPFEPLGDTDHRQWVPKAIQQSIAAEVARLGGLVPVIVSPTATEPLDGAGETAVAREQARAAKGDIVIYGACQFNGTDVRLTGEIEDLTQAKTLGGLKASGDFKDLFQLEDQLAGEVQRILRPAVAIDANTQNVATATNPAGAIHSLTAGDLFAPQPDTVRFGDQYNRYYYGTAYIPYLTYGYPGTLFPVPVYSIYNGGYYPDINGDFPFGNGGFDGVTIIIGRRDHRRDADRDRRNDRDGDGSSNTSSDGTTSNQPPAVKPPPIVKPWNSPPGIGPIEPGKFQPSQPHPVQSPAPGAAIAAPASPPMPPEPSRPPQIDGHPDMPSQGQIGKGGQSGQSSQLNEGNRGN